MPFASKVRYGHAELTNEFAEIANAIAELTNEFAEIANEFAEITNEFAEIANGFAESTNEFAEIANGHAESTRLRFFDENFRSQRCDKSSQRRDKSPSLQ
ncbi:hypothetical protein [Nostoc sp. CALU 1950]|uniref:hypothetical protein n=1 Tax=Nostoc sp. CALU 1950 TaxID=3104321 RepID=UPI003EBD799E